jgi:hypothetical protein
LKAGVKMRFSCRWVIAEKDGRHQETNHGQIAVVARSTLC